MKVCVISFKELWRDGEARLVTDGGFPRQMRAIGSLFDEMTLLTPIVPARRGGSPLPDSLRHVPLPQPTGVDLRRKLSVAAGAARHVRIMAREIRRADAVHVPLPGDLPFIGMVMAQVLRKPLLARYCSSWPVNAETTVMNRVTKRWMRLAAGGRNVMLATGDDDRPPAPGMHWIFATAMWASELGPLSARLDRGLSSPPRLVYAGRLAPEKGLSVLLRALALLARDASGLQPTLTVAGDGPDRLELEQEARRLPPGRVTFTGLLDREALSHCFLDADVCVQPSHTESLAKVWLDAMAHGLPVIASDVGSARTAIGTAGERGLVVPPNDPAALAAALVSIASGTFRDWPALRRRCHDYVRSRTLDAWAERAGRLCASQWRLSFVDGKLRP